MLFTRSQFSNLSATRFTSGGLQQRLSPGVRRSSFRYEQIGQLMGADMNQFQRQLQAINGRYYPRVSANQDAQDHDYSDLLLDFVRRSSSSIFGQLSENIGENGNIMVSRRGGNSQKQTYAQLAQLLQLGLSKNR